MSGRSAFGLVKPETLEPLSHIFKVWANLQTSFLSFYEKILLMCFAESLALCLHTRCCHMCRSDVKKYIDFIISSDEEKVKI